MKKLIPITTIVVATLAAQLTPRVRAQTSATAENPPTIDAGSALAPLADYGQTRTPYPENRGPQNSFSLEGDPRAGGGFYYHPNGRSAENVNSTIIRFSDGDSTTIDALQEDMNVMGFLLERNVDRALKEDPTPYKSGIPMLLKSGSRSVRALYLEGFGALFTFHVSFPLVAPPAMEPKKTAPSGGTEWDNARHELYGRPDEPNAWAGSATAGNFVEYNQGQVESLKKEILQSLKNAANIRELKADEQIVVTVFGSESVALARGAGAPVGGLGTTETPDDPNKPREAGATAFGRPERSALAGGVAQPGQGRATVLTVRVRKADAAALAKGGLSFDEFQRKATVRASLGNSLTPRVESWGTTGNSPLFRASESDLQRR